MPEGSWIDAGLLSKAKLVLTNWKLWLSSYSWRMPLTQGSYTVRIKQHAVSVSCYFFKFGVTIPISLLFSQNINEWGVLPVVNGFGSKLVILNVIFWNDQFLIRDIYKNSDKNKTYFFCQEYVGATKSRKTTVKL